MEHTNPRWLVTALRVRLAAGTGLAMMDIFHRLPVFFRYRAYVIVTV